MKNATRIDEIEEFLRDGGGLDELMIEPEPSRYSLQYSRVGIMVDKQKEETHESYGEN